MCVFAVCHLIEVVRAISNTKDVQRAFTLLLQNGIDKITIITFMHAQNADLHVNEMKRTMVAYLAQQLSNERERCGNVLKNAIEIGDAVCQNTNRQLVVSRQYVSL